jgi:hypothetical protein
MHAWGSPVSFVEKRAEIAILSSVGREVVNRLAGLVTTAAQKPRWLPTDKSHCTNDLTAHHAPASAVVFRVR